MKQTIIPRLVSNVYSRHGLFEISLIAVTLLAIGTARADTVWLDELDVSQALQGWGEPQKNQSVDGNPLTIGGREFERGFGTHAPGTLEIKLNGNASSFSAMVGVDDEVSGNPASIQFFVLGDGETLWKSEIMRAGDPALPVEVDLAGVKTLVLQVGDGGDDINYDHADWANAKLEVTGPVEVVRTEQEIEFVPISEAEIRAPEPPATPRINGPAIFGVRPGHPFLYRIPATGDRPMEFSVAGLPDGLQVDSATGQITGSLADNGEHWVTLRAKNSKGGDEKEFKIVVGETIALTPPLGWNSWNCWGPMVDAGKVRQSAQAMVDSGLINHGWTFINIDDAWQGKRGGEFNGIQPNEKFPDMKALCDEVHALGLKIGIYSTPWVTSYAGYIGGSADNSEGTWTPPEDRGLRLHGKYSFAENDANQWAAWGIDYLKYDWNPRSSSPPESLEDFEKHVATMVGALRNSGRDLLYSYSNSMPFEYIPQISKYFNCWRTTGDIRDEWWSIVSIGFSQDRWAPFSGPGHWNDPDMLVVGYVDVGRGRNLHPSRLAPDEQYSHITLWSLLAAPMLIGCDMTRLDDFTLNLLCNDEVLAVNQDPLGQQATLVSEQGGQIMVRRSGRSQARAVTPRQVWARPLADGSMAVGLFNLGVEPAEVTANWSDLNISGRQVVRDLWRQKDLGTFEDEFSLTVAPHGAEMVKIKAVR